MHPPSRQPRINLTELKARLFKRLGPEKSGQYFDCLNRLLSLRLNKLEFDKRCLKLLGKANLPLHNQLIRALLQNACNAKAPPAMPVHSKGTCVTADNGSIPLRNNLTTSLGQNGGGDLVSLSHISGHKISYRVLENGSLKSCDSQTTLQHHQELAGDGFPSDYGRVKSQALAVEEENNVHKFSRRQLQAPLGTLFHPVTGRSRCSRSSDTGGLLDTNSLRERMQHIAADQGLEGATLDCASLLNLGLNSYLKTLIGSCIQLARTRSDSKLTNKSLQKDRPQQRLVNGVFLREERSRFLITMVDFESAIELKPQDLGEDGSSLHEKISVHAMKG